ncbi:protein delta homolog 2 isoform X1 [Hippoglossus hippoglossus]|uniref:protein delta homolog 2 isoform X1 n=2 Tax=Hippoglossus hippoglossus TaxID=8267 RepID=UPI00148D8E94|nr:protein delta homolog 2 isoform X1 [Hippoglossus hippoglossus]XP_034465023.1 protein delta homolog 2 isoform X1 [Hippoglossus hippoglossus]
MSAVRAASVLLSVCVLVVLVVLPCSAQGSNCSCNITNSHCDESRVCRCDPGWDGERCDRCVPMPGCVHGSCQQPWQCSCEPGWGGRFCDKDLFICSEQPCENGATCVMEDSGDFICLCPESYHGNNCQLKIGPCHQRRSPCKNGGLCEDADGFAAELTCRCLAGFTGSRCETNVDDCLMKPCGNGATCLDGINRFSCLCPSGFTGRFCTINLNDCASRPCLNAGRCLDRARGFHCVCRAGFTGATCQTLLRSRDALEAGWTTMGWEGPGGGEVRNHRTSSNSSRCDDQLFKVTVSERGTVGLSDVQLIILLMLAALTLGVVVLTAALVLQGQCRDCGHAPCWSLTSSSSEHKSRRRVQRDEQGGRISFLNAAEPEKKKHNAEVV